MALTESIARDTLKELDDIKKQISFSLKSLNNMFVAAVKNNPEANVKFKEDFAATMDSLKNMQANIGKMTETMENYSNSEVIDISFPNTFAKDYLQAKMQHQDSILMYKYGDYYVMVGDDAEKAAHILEMPTQKAALGGSKDDTVLVIPQSYAAFYGDRVKATHESVVMVKDTPPAVLTPQQEVEMNIPKEYRPFFNVMKQSGKTREEVREIIANPEGFEHLLPGDIKHDVKDLETVIDETFKSGVVAAEKSNIEKTVEPRPEWLDYFADKKGNSPKTIGDLMHDMYFGDIKQPLPTASLRACFHRYCSALDEQIEMQLSPYVAPEDKETYRETLAQRRKEFTTAITGYFNTQHKVIVAAVAAGLSPEDTVRYLEKKPKDMPEALRNALPEDMRIPASKMMSSQQIVNRGPIAPGEAYDILHNNAKNFEDYNRALTKYFPVMEDVRLAVEREEGLTPPTGRIADQEKGYEILSYNQDNHVIKFGKFENITPDEILELSKKYASEGIYHRGDPKKSVDRLFGNYDIFSENLSSAKKFAEEIANLDKSRGLRQELNKLITEKKCEDVALELSGTTKVWETLSAFKAYKTSTASAPHDKPLSILEFYENIEDAKTNYDPVFLEDIPYEKRDAAISLVIDTLKGMQPCIADNNEFVKSVTVDISYKGEKYKDVVLPLYKEGEEPDIQRYYLHDEDGPWTAAKVGDDMIDFQIYGDGNDPEILHVEAILCKLDQKNNIYSQDRTLDQDLPDPEIQISNIRVQYVNGKEEVQEVNGGIILDGPVRDNSQNEVLPEEEGIDEEKEVSRGFHR